MALSDYLADLLTPQNISSIASGVLGLYGANRAGSALQGAYAPNVYDQQYQQLASQLAALTGEMIDPNSAGFRSRVDARRDEITRQYEQALRQQQALEARRYARTGMGMINPERRDEALSRSLASFRSQAEAQARNEALQEMIAAAQTGRGAAQVTGTGLANERARQVASANVGNAYDQAKNAGWLQLGQAVLGPLLKNVDIGKAIQAVTGGGGAGGATVPRLPGGEGLTMYGGDLSGLDWGAGPTGGISTASLPSFGSDLQGQAWGVNPGGLGLPDVDFTGGWNMDWGFPMQGGDPSGYTDPGYGWAPPEAPNLTMANFPSMPELPSFDTQTFDFGNWSMPSFDFDTSWLGDIGYGY